MLNVLKFFCIETAIYDENNGIGAGSAMALILRQRCR